jgi:hypothetical protein
MTWEELQVVKSTYLLELGYGTLDQQLGRRIVLLNLRLDIGEY